MFGEGTDPENNKDHISQSRGSALDGEEHIGEWWMMKLATNMSWMKS